MMQTIAVKECQCVIKMFVAMCTNVLEVISVDLFGGWTYQLITFKI